MSKLSKNRRFHMERLEDRQMMAGDVAAGLEGGHLFLNEAAGQAGLDNAVTISQVGRGVIRVQGAATADGTFSKINGADFQDFLASDLTVLFGGGKDKVSFVGTTPVNFQNVTLNVGVDSALGDADKDTLSLSKLQVRGGLIVATGASDDLVFLSQSTVGDGVGTDGALFYMGAGADFLSLDSGSRIRGSVDVQMYKSLAENDVDNVAFDTNLLIEGGANVRTGGGDDFFLVGLKPSDKELAVQINGSLVVTTNGGNDTINITRVLVGDGGYGMLRINSGAGADSVEIGNPTGFLPLSLPNVDIQTYLSLDEVDTDVVKMQNALIFGNLDVRMGGGDDKFFVTNPDDVAIVAGISVFGAMNAATDAGNDQIYVENSSVGDSVAENLVIRTGAGADLVTLDFRRSVSPNITPREVAGNIDIQTYASLAELDADQVKIINGIVRDSIFAKLGGGNDKFELANFVQVSNDIDLDAGAGHDTAIIDAFAIDHVMLRMGSGSDTLAIKNLFAYRLIALGEDGFDRVSGLAKAKTKFRDILGWEMRDDATNTPRLLAM